MSNYAQLQLVYDTMDGRLYPRYYIHDEYQTRLGQHSFLLKKHIFLYDFEAHAGRQIDIGTRNISY